MGYTLIPCNKKLKEFDFGAFSFPILLNACGYLFISIHNMGRWHFVSGVDRRMGKGYPRILTNNGFKVTAEEAKIMARMASNLVTIQRNLPTLENYDCPNDWPLKIRDDFVDKFDAFSRWAKKSNGFKIC